MLEPQERRQLLDCLRPPEGYSLDAAVGTTYSLDLLALLTAPVAFTFFDWENEAGRPTANPHALLAAIRRNADRMALFCQAGGIHIPSGDKRLFSYLEDSVFQCIPRTRGCVSSQGLVSPLHRARRAGSLPVSLPQPESDL